jgi:hypothetical protein
MTNTSATPLMSATWVVTVTQLVILSKWVVARPMEVTKNESIIGIVMTTKILYNGSKSWFRILTLKLAGWGGFCPRSTDMACIPSIFIKTFQKKF